MKAIQYRSHGGPEVVQYEDIAVPKLAPGESLIRVQKCGYQFVDIYHRQGFYSVPLPFTPGIEGVGIVESEGGDLKPGTRVCWVMVPGAFAEYAAVPNWKPVPVPDFIDNHTAAAALAQ
jgi:NADPH2:quinone reductase